MKIFVPPLFLAALCRLQKYTRMKTYGYIAVVSLASCTSNEVHWDAMKMREHLIDYYDDEIMDNLIRAKNGQVFVHVDISTLTASVTSKLAGNVGGGQTLNNTGSRVSTTPAATRQIGTTTGPTGATIQTVTTDTFGTAVGIAGTITRMATRPFTFSVAPERSDKLDIISSPVVNNPKAYEPYLQFLNLHATRDNPTPRLSDGGGSELDITKTIESVVEDLSPPKVDYVSDTLRKKGKHYYYVPTAYKQAYFDLCLALMKREAVENPATKRLQDRIDQILTDTP